jgi:hydrogenase maturation protease
LVAVRVLCLGNDLLADDSLGGLVAERLRKHLPPSVEVVYTPNTGYSLLDNMMDAPRLVVVDTVLTGGAEPGTVFVLKEQELVSVPGGSPHYTGLLETLELARMLQLPVPDEVVIVAVEAADCTTVGGDMHPAVERAVPKVVKLVRGIVESSTQLALPLE